MRYNSVRDEGWICNTVLAELRLMAEKIPDVLLTNYRRTPQADSHSMNAPKTL